jgi:hypothetical protein
MQPSQTQPELRVVLPKVFVAELSRTRHPFPTGTSWMACCPRQSPHSTGRRWPTCRRPGVRRTSRLCRHQGRGRACRYRAGIPHATPLRAFDRWPLWKPLSTNPTIDPMRATGSGLHPDAPGHRELHLATGPQCTAVRPAGPPRPGAQPRLAGPSRRGPSQPCRRAAADASEARGRPVLRADGRRPGMEGVPYHRRKVDHGGFVRFTAKMLADADPATRASRRLVRWSTSWSPSSCRPLPSSTSAVPPPSRRPASTPHSSLMTSSVVTCSLISLGLSARCPRAGRPRDPPRWCRHDRRAHRAREGLGARPPRLSCWQRAGAPRHPSPGGGGCGGPGQG